MKSLLSLNYYRAFFCAGLVLLSACDETPQVAPQPQESSSQAPLKATELDLKRTEYAQLMARALQKVEVRQLLKTEALKQFDKDYDVLIPLIKQEKVGLDLTLNNYLKSLASSDESYQDLTNNLPLVTVFVPKLAHFSADSWDVNTQIPIVAVLNSNHDERTNTKLVAYDYTGKQFELDSNVAPDIPVIVIKENERVIVSNKRNGARLSTTSDSKNGSIAYDYIDNAFDPQKTKETNVRNARISFKQSFDIRLRDAFNLGAVSHRDYIYYNILNSTDEGPLNTDYAEFLRQISFENQSSLDYASDDDWEDGNLEISINFLFLNGDSNIDNINKMLSIPRDQFITNAYGETYTYDIPYNLEIATWDMEKYGDTWKFIVQEIDPNSVTTVTKQVSSKFGANFKFDGSIGKRVKVGYSFGGSAETSKTATTTVQVTGTSDFLGEGIFNFTDKIIIRKYRVSLLDYYETYTHSTGMVRLSIEPDYRY